MSPVSMRLPLRSEYVMIARLTASGYCARLGIDLDSTEDIKVTISEVLNKCISSDMIRSDEADIDFSADNTFFIITFYIKDIRGMIGSESDDDLGFAIIKSLCDELEFQHDDILSIKFRMKERE